MTASPFDSALFGPLFADPSIAAHFADGERLRRMLLVEAALARVEGRIGIIPEKAAAAIEKAAGALVIEPAGLAAATASAGVPVMALVAELRKAAGGEAAGHVHHGATSQDIVETALALTLQDVLDHLERQLLALAGSLAALADTHRDTILPARTRGQQALPTSFGLKVAGWRAPLVRHLERLAELRPRVLMVQFGGAAGTLAALGDRGVEVMEALAAELGLACPPLPWHAQRDGMIELASWFSLVTGALGKIGQDLLLQAQSEVLEIRAGPGGGSSTMPQKANPVLAETLVTLARFNAGLVGTMHQAAIQEHERGGSGWALEWLCLPQMAVAAGASLRHGLAILDAMSVDTVRMRAHVDASNGLLLAEAASFALARHMPRAEAQEMVADACAEATRSGKNLFSILAARSDAPLDWQALADPARYLGSAARLIDRALKPR